jgi:actin-related protein
LKFASLKLTLIYLTAQRYLLHALPRKLILVLPPAFPYPLLSTLLMTLFTNFQLPLVTLLSSPVLATVAAGLRSSLIVDIGWHETIITGVFELRELLHCRSDRAGKMLNREMGKLLAIESMKSQERHEAKHRLDDEEDISDKVSFEETEDVLGRVAWCRSYNEALRLRPTSRQEPPGETFADAPEQLGRLSIPEDAIEDTSPTPDRGATDPTITIPLRSTASPITLQLSFSRLAEPCETALFASNAADGEDWDDNEVPVHHLAYNALLSLPRDARGICMSRIIITGGVSDIPGLKNRIIDEVAALFMERGWDRVRGKAAERRRKRLEEIKRNFLVPGRSGEAQEATERSHDDTTLTLHTSPAFEEPEIDPVEETLRRENPPKAHVHGIVRGVETLGPWAGGALLGNLKVKGVAQIEQDKFLQHGLAGASKEGDVSAVTQRYSVGQAGPRAGTAGERSSWTLGVFG